MDEISKEILFKIIRSSVDQMLIVIPSVDLFWNRLVAELVRQLRLSFALLVEEDPHHCQELYVDRSLLPFLIPLVNFPVAFSNVSFNCGSVMQESRLAQFVFAGNLKRNRSTQFRKSPRTTLKLGRT